jgi:hypothetical protein
MHEPNIAAPAHERPVAPELEADSHAAPSAGGDPALADDPHVMQILSTEHWSLISARSLAYNEAFTRASMFLTFLSMSFVALALLAQAMGFRQDFLVIAAIVFGFDFVIGALTYLRLAGTGKEDLVAIQGMNRIRHAYVRIAPQVKPYFSVGTNDDLPSVWKTYGLDQNDTKADVAYAFSTSHGLVGIVMALVGGIEGAIIALLLGASMLPAIVVAVVVTLVIVVVVAWWSFRRAAMYQAALEVRFPAAADEQPSR